MLPLWGAHRRQGGPSGSAACFDAVLNPGRLKDRLGPIRQPELDQLGSGAQGVPLAEHQGPTTSRHYGWDVHYLTFS